MVIGNCVNFVDCKIFGLFAGVFATIMKRITDYITICSAISRHMLSHRRIVAPQSTRRLYKKLSGLRALGGLVAILVIGVVVATGCDRHSAVWSELDRADALMEEHPDSSLRILEAIRSDSLSGEELARHSLLISMALDKNYIDLTDDSVVNIAVDYYDESDDIRNRMLANYYKGRIGYNSENYSSATKNALIAEELSRDDYPAWNAKAYELLADICHKTFVREKEIEYRREAIRVYHKLGLDRNAAYTELDLAIAYNNNGESKKALSIIKKVEKEAIVAHNDSVLAAITMSLSLPILRSCGNHVAVIEKFDSLSRLTSFNNLSSQDYRVVGESLLKLGRRQESEMYMERALQLSVNDYDANIALVLKGNILKESGDVQGMLAMVDSLLNFQNEYVGMILSQSYLDSHNAYLKDKISKEERQSMKKQIMLIAVVVILVIVVIVVIVLSRVRFKRMDQELKKSMDDAFVLSQELLGKAHLMEELNSVRNDFSMELKKDKEEIEQLKAKLHIHEENSVTAMNEIRQIQDRRDSLETLVSSLLSQYYININSLCEQYYVNSDSEVNLRLLHKKVTEQIEQLGKPETLDKIIDAVNSCMDNIIIRIGERMKLERNDEVLLALNYAGFSVKAQAVILKLSTKGIYTRRSRLYAKIKELNMKTPLVLKLFA